ncbi:MAG: PhzF family phenazine biosynthesis protein [Ruminococcus sp.]|nr:PhzF family phenazine biosynthesis protein [Ruminococcus sp.]
MLYVFTERLFSGNPAAVCILEDWLPDELMQSISKENNFSETAFVVKDKNEYELRWFTPGGEIDFCGHATLGTAYVISNFIDKNCRQIIFKTLSGKINVSVVNDILFEFNFPKYNLNKIPVTNKMTEAIGTQPAEAYLDRDLLLVVDSEDKVINLKPDMSKIKELEGMCVAVTAKGEEYDCISRVLAPKMNVAEDPVTGSTHCMIVPYWANKLNKNKIIAYQASSRAGMLYSEMYGDMVKIAGKVVLYAISEILPDI